MKISYHVAAFILILGRFCLAQNNGVPGQVKPEYIENTFITILYNNISVADSIFADHGFSCLVESENYTCLFDAGNNSKKFMTNVNNSGADYSAIDLVFISHLHNDHMGGLFDILDKLDKPVLCMPVSYPRQEGESFGDRADKDYQTMLDRLNPLVSELFQRKALARIDDDFYTTGVIEKRSFEQSLIVRTSKGLIIITGCAHQGILEIVNHARELMKQDVLFVMGGFHLISTEPARIDTVARELRMLTKHIGPCHCTGDKAQAILKDIFKEDYIDIKAGLKLKLGADILK